MTRRRIAQWVLALVVVIAGVGYFRVRGQAGIGAGYVAKEVCSCMFVGGRSLESCRGDVPESMDAVRAEALTDGVRGFVPLLAARIARHEPGFGCTLH